MSMLTPLGRGGALSFRRRRRWPRVLAAVLVIALVAAAGVGAWWWWSQRDDNVSASPRKTCVTPTPHVPKALPVPKKIQVGVFNGTDKVGLAASASDDLRRLGFDVVEVGNTKKPVAQAVAQVRYDDHDLASAVVVASYLPGARLVSAQPKGKPVQVWLGPDFSSVASNAQADPQTVALPAEQPQCHRQSNQR